MNDPAVPTAGDNDPLAWLRHATAAWEYMRRGEAASAESQFELALHALGDDSGSGQVDPEAPTADLLLGQVTARMLLGRAEEAERTLLNRFRMTEPDASASASVVQLRAWLAWSTLPNLARRWAETVNRVDEVLTRLPTGQADGSAWTVLRARLLERKATALSASGHVTQAQALFRQIIAVFERPSQGELSMEHANALLNFGASQFHSNNAREAEAPIRRALVIFEGLVEAGRTQARRHLGQAQMNLGLVLHECGRLEEALHQLVQAAATYDAEIRRLAGRPPVAQIRASRALVETNRAHTLYSMGRFDEAASHFRSGRRRYLALRIAAPQVKEDETRAWINLAHLQARQGLPAAAARTYRRAWRALEALITDGRANLATSSALARLGLARALLLQSRERQAAAHFTAGMNTFVVLAAQGQLQQGHEWLRLLVEHIDVGVQARLCAPETPAAILQALARPASYSVAVPGALCEQVEEVLGRMQVWRTGAPEVAWLDEVDRELLLHLMDRVAALLGGAEPDALRDAADACRRVVASLAAAAARRTGLPHLMADWFLRTRGLRAQRSALAQGRDHRLAELRERLARLHRLEERLLAQPQAGADARKISVPTDAAADRESWLELQADCEARRRALVAEGLLPPLLRLDAQTLSASMVRGSALLMLARGPAGDLSLTALHPPDRGGAIAHTVVASPAEPSKRTFDARVGNLLIRRELMFEHQTQALRRAANSPLEAIEAEAARPPAAGSMEDHLLDQWRKAVGEVFEPLVQQLASAGCTQLSLVPSEDLHLMPFHELLEDLLSRTGARLAVYPSCGAWARNTVLAGGRPRRGETVRWALAAPASAADKEPLPWVAVERLLSLRLWGPGSGIVQLPPEHPVAHGVSALLGMGHGHAADDNPALAGLLLAPGKLLSGHDLPSIRTCRLVLLSCCVLGRVDEVHAEPMGFLSACFGYECRFAVGWLVEVPDAEACLFSLVMQFALRERARARGRDDSCQVFRRVRSAIQRGQWPEGFGAWLEQELPAATRAAEVAPGPWLNRYEYLRDFEGGLFRAPPADLRRLMRWVVALGR